MNIYDIYISSIDEDGLDHNYKIIALSMEDAINTVSQNMGTRSIITGAGRNDKIDMLSIDIIKTINIGDK